MVAFASLKDYGPTFQVKVISSLLKNKAFLLNVRDITDESHFEHPGNKWILTETLKYFDKFHTTPTLDSLKIEVKKISRVKSVYRPENLICAFYVEILSYHLCPNNKYS